MRDLGVIDALDALERYARAFDEISRESDAHYSARSFVRWVAAGDDGSTRRGAVAGRHRGASFERVTERVSLVVPRSGLQRIGRDA
jgi:hypothetical protein